MPPQSLFSNGRRRFDDSDNEVLDEEVNENKILPRQKLSKQSPQSVVLPNWSEERKEPMGSNWRMGRVRVQDEFDEQVDEDEGYSPNLIDEHQ